MGDGVSYLKVLTIADKVSLVRYQGILHTNRGVMRLESPLVPPQEIGIVDILSSFQPNTLFYQKLMGRNRESSAQDR